MVEILIVEDSAPQAKHLQHMLQGGGYRLRIARNGREALAAVEQSLPGLVISDVVMPEMDGFELCRRLKQDGRLRTVPVILLTALSNPAEMTRGLESGVDDFLFRPFTQSYVLARIEQTLAHRRLREELIAAEASLRQSNDRLAATNQELESFCYSVSHDLRAPLRHIMGYVQILEDVPASELSAETQHHLKVIGNSAQRMTQLINDLLEFSRMGRTEMRHSPVELNELVEEVVRELATETQGRTIDWSIAALPRVNADRALIRQVFANLIGNAVKYSRKRAKAHIAVEARQDQEEVVVSVRDNGTGFDPAYAGRLFGVFQRLHRDDEFEGTGIGLANVRRIVTRHGGRVWGEGRPGEGATFYFTLPAAGAAI